MAEVRAQSGVPVLAQFAGLGAPTLCAPLVVDSATGFIYSLKTGDVVVAAGAAGTVTSVAQSFTGGLITVAGSPVTTTGTLALTIAGTSGGIPYFSGATTWASSGALTNHAVVLGGGAGAAPVTISVGANNTYLKGATGANPAFATITLASADFANQGTATTVLHGNAAGNPSFGAVSLTADVSGVLPVANGGTGNATWLTSWTPTRTGWTDVGTPTVTARYAVISNNVFFQVKVVPATTIAAAGGTSYIDLPVAMNASALSGDGSMLNETTLIGVGNLVFDVANSRCYVPTQAATGNTLGISGWYEK